MVIIMYIITLFSISKSGMLDQKICTFWIHLTQKYAHFEFIKNSEGMPLLKGTVPLTMCWSVNFLNIWFYQFVLCFPIWQGKNVISVLFSSTFSWAMVLSMFACLLVIPFFGFTCKRYEMLLEMKKTK